MWVENEARRANRNLIVVNGLIAVVLVLIIAANFRYCVNFLRGCEPISAAELANLKSPEQRWRNFVTVTGDKVGKAGYEDIEERRQGGQVVSTEVKAEYIYLRVVDKILLVKASPGEGRLEYSGELTPTEGRIQDNLLRPFAAQQPELGAMLLPYTLNAANYRNNGYAMLGIMVPLLALAMWNILKAVRRSSEPQSAPAWKALSAFGNAEQLSQQIEADLQSGGVRKYGNLQVGGQWMVRRKTFSTWVSPISDLAWVYKKVTKHSVNFIPTGKTYSVILVGRHRQRTEEQMKEKTVNELLGDLAGRVPWAIFGFDQKLDRAWRKDPQSVISAVDSRFQQYKSKAAAPATT
jgi:uncharacterized protein DUF6709